MSFSENIKFYRTAANLTQEQLASAVGISAQAVSKWENNESLPDTALLPEIADALNATIDELFGHTPKSVDPLYRTLAAQLAGKTNEESVHLLFDIVLSSFRSVFGEYPIPELKGEREDRPSFGTDMDSRKFDIVTSDYYVVSETGLAQAYESKFFPYAAVVLEPEEGWQSLLNSTLAGDFIRAVGDEDVMKCLRYLLRRNEKVTMESTLLLKKAGCDLSRKDEILQKLEQIHTAYPETVEINGQPREIVSYYPGHMPRRLLPFFAAAYAASTVTFGNGHRSGHMDRTLL